MADVPVPSIATATPDNDDHLVGTKDGSVRRFQVSEFSQASRTTALEQETAGYRAAGDPISEEAAVGFVWTVTDEDGNVAIGVKSDGTFAAEAATMSTADIGQLTTAGSTILDDPHVGFAVVWEDANGNAPVGIKEDGTLAAESIEVTHINGRPVGSGAIDRSGGAYPFKINFHNNAGESLAEGSTGTAITTFVQYDNIGFPARASAPSAFVSLDVANTQYAARGENPMYGALAHVKALIERENGLAYQDNDFQLLACNNGYSGYKLAQHISGTDPYTRMMSQATAGASIAGDKSFGVLATFLTTGANDGNPEDLTPTATFKAQLLQFAVDLNDDFKAATGQLQDSITIVGQVASRAPQLAVAQLEASNESPLIYLACPMYQLSYYDTLHITPASERILGAYYGLVEKRVVVDRAGWEPLQPVASMIVGNSVYLRFNKSGLAFDTTLIPLQTNYGFDVRDGSDASVSISAVAIAGRDTVRLDFASAPAAGWKVRYGHNTSSGRADSFAGGSGNLRDNQGSQIPLFDSTPLHNWCVIFSQTI